MQVVLSPDQMRDVEAAAMGSGRVTGAELMARAGAAVVAAAQARWPELAAAPGRAVVLAGQGGNGGDGYVVARLLAERGWEVNVFALGPPKGDADAMAAAWGGAPRPFEALEPEDLRGAALVIDALFGLGLGRPVSAAVGRALGLAQEAGARLVAVDILSGLSAETGQVLTEGPFPEAPADLTVTFAAPKLGHVLAPGAALSGPLVVADIGLGPWLPEEGAVRLAGPGGIATKAQGHKYEHGHLMVFAGGVGRGGAARLAARGGLRIGAGAVTIAVPPAALQENAARLDAIMLRKAAGAEEAAALLDDPRINALVLGPGLGVQRAAELLPVALGRGCPAVLDADALTALAEDESLRAQLHARCVLTPHAGEFARLCPDLAEELAAGGSKLAATRAAAARLGAVLLLKGPDTVIADPAGRAAISAAAGEGAVPWLATAGAGDVLAGIIGGLLARGWDPFAAAASAAWAHQAAARHVGPGLIAEDLPEALPAVLRSLA
ncbi:NAD(P)H-hydrate dehydratase [Pseudoroseicyclus sp. CXY001]|uniref:NAD(P)H-hydrate dehydratase n=1 Tax=Pseudoroseicyclus sp. CXY001 TaxID=3242492 RepID=UPI003570B972